MEGERLLERERELWTVEREPIRAEERRRQKISSIHCEYAVFEMEHLKETSSRQLMIGI